MAWSENAWARRADAASKACAVAGVFVLPFPVALFSVTMGLAVILWMVSGRCLEKLRCVLANPIVPWVLVMLGLLAAGALYSTGETEDIRAALSKYSKLFYIPILIAILHEPVWRGRALRGFFLSLVVVLVLSYGKLVGIVPGDWLATDFRFVIAKTKILHSMLMAILVYLSLDEFLKRNRWQWGYAVIAAAAAANLFFMVNGRIGYLLVIVLLLILFLQRGQWKAVVIGTAAIAVAIPLLYFTSATFRGRIEYSQLEWARYQEIREAGRHVQADNSIGIRLEHYANTAKLIRQHPLVGTGTGSWNREYRALVTSPEAVILLDTHSEYLMFWVQLGIFGLAFYLVILIVQWRASFRLDADARVLAQAVIAMIFVSGFFNSSLLYSHEGKVYVVMLGVAFAGLSGRARGAKTKEEAPA